MPEPTAVTKRPPVFFSLAILIAALIVPIFMLFDRQNAAGGDGLQGFWERLLIFSGCASASAICIVLDWKRDERPRWLILLALASWLAPVFVLMI